MPGAFCMMSFRMVRRNLSWPRIFLCFFSRNLFLSSTSHVENRFIRDGATSVLCMFRINFASPNFYSANKNVRRESSNQMSEQSLVTSIRLLLGSVM